MSWRDLRLGDAIRIKHGFAFKGKFFTDSGTHIVLTPGNFHEKGGFRLRPGKDRYYSGEIPDGYILDERDLIIAMTEQGPGLLGSSALIPEGVKCLHNQRLGLVEVQDKSVLDKRFLYHLFNTKPVRAQIIGSATGTKVRHTAPERINNVTVSIPPSVDEQRRISEVISAYDELIGSNWRRIWLIEQTTRLLYEEWFVHLRFPGHERVTITNGVPDRWERTTVADAIEVNPKEKFCTSSFVRYTPMSGLSTSLMTVDLTKLEKRIKPTAVRFRNGDTLFARITPSLENGKTGFVNFLDDDEIACGSTEFIVLRGKLVSAYFVYCLARTSHFRQSAIKSMIGSSGRQRVQVSCFDDYSIVIPSQFVRDQFDKICESMFSQIANLVAQMYSLGKARDLLLPRMMSGDFRYD